MAGSEQALELRTPIAALSSSGNSPEGVNVCLLDTPGPNEAGEENLRAQVQSCHLVLLSVHPKPFILRCELLGICSCAQS